jgi:hypothetical protein
VTQVAVTAEPLPATEAPAVEEPVVSQRPVVTGIPGEGGPGKDDWRPQPGDEKLERGEVIIDESGILTLESFPPQFVLHVSGTKGDPCRVVRAVVPEPDEQNRIQVEVYSLFDPAALCIQVVKGFDLNLPLGSFPKEYSGVNGAMVGRSSHREMVCNRTGSTLSVSYSCPIQRSACTNRRS